MNVSGIKINALFPRRYAPRNLFKVAEVAPLKIIYDVIYIITVDLEPLENPWVSKWPFSAEA